MPSFRSDLRDESRRLGAALERLDALVDWERRDRHPERGPRMRQSVAPARDLLDRLDSPDRDLRCVLVAGTKGKGSVASLVGAGLRRDGRAEAVYGSPHVERVNERVRLAGAPIRGEPLAAALEAALDARESALRAGTPAAEATWFDVLTAGAVEAMKRAEVEWAILECGLGGRLDSTNAVEPELSVVTNIGLEHTAILGSTHAEIAREKAGIARPGRPLVSGVGGAAAATVATVAAQLGARLVPVPLDARASIEDSNAALAGAVLRELGAGRLDPRARAAARLPGRPGALLVRRDAGRPRRGSRARQPGPGPRGPRRIRALGASGGRPGYRSGQGRGGAAQGAPRPCR